jgi:hypothetical protein
MNTSIHELVVLGAPGSSVRNALGGRRPPSRTSPAGPRIRMARHAATLWYSLQYSFEIEASGPSTPSRRYPVRMR